MSAFSTVHGVLTGPEAARASSPADIAQVVVEALVDDGLLDSSQAPRCRSLSEMTSGNLRRCEKARKHPLPHGNGDRTWTDDQAAGVLRERN